MNHTKNIGAGSFGNTVGVFLLTFPTACLLTSFCLILFYHSFSTHKSDCNSDWHRSAFLPMAQWSEWKFTEMVEQKWGLCCAAASCCCALEFPILCSVLWTTDTALQGWLAVGKILSHKGWDRQQPFPGAFPWDSWPSQCHIMLWALCRENQQLNLLWKAQGSLAWKTFVLLILKGLW